jgi:hypothetical protein
MTIEAFIDGALDTVILLGILFTALFTVFRLGRWTQKLLDSQEAMHRKLDAHIADEDKRFDRIDVCGKALRLDISELERICTNGNGRARIGG